MNVCDQGVCANPPFLIGLELREASAVVKQAVSASVGGKRREVAAD